MQSIETNIESTLSEPKKICSPQSTFKDYCNTCACSDDGLSFVCTKMYCDPEVYNQDGSLKVKTWSSDEPLESKGSCWYFYLKN